MRLPEFIIKMLRKKSGNDLYLPSDCEFLSLDIESNLGIHIGATTLKRLLGFANDGRTPHASTLEVLAKYLGYAHWEDAVNQEEKYSSGFDTPEDEIRAANLTVGDRVDITYSPDRHVVFEYVGDDYFVVVEREGNKLELGDRLQIQNFILHHPFYARNVYRGDECLGPYSAAVVSGIDTLKLIEK